MKQVMKQVNCKQVGLTVTREKIEFSQSGAKFYKFVFSLPDGKSNELMVQYKSRFGKLAKEPLMASQAYLEAISQFNSHNNVVLTHIPRVKVL